MKKILLIIALLLLSGCYDYKEINKLSIITAIGIDYKDEEYIVTFEVLNDQGDKDSNETKAFIRTNKDKSLAKAIENTANLLTDEPNYTHVKLMVLGNGIIDGHFDNIIDFFMRSTYFRENFFVVSSLSHDAKKILETTSKENPVASSGIIDMLESLRYSGNSSILKTFDQIIEETTAFGKDTCFSNITLDEELFKVDGLVTFDKYDFKDVLDNDMASIYNLLKGDFIRPIYDKDYDGKYFSVAITEGKAQASVSNKEIRVKGKLTGKIMDNEPNFSIRELDALDRLNNDFKKIINDKIEEFMKIIQENKTDILFLAANYYQKTRIKEENFWVNLDIVSDVDFNINKKGLIYEVQNENE